MEITPEVVISQHSEYSEARRKGMILHAISQGRLKTSSPSHYAKQADKELYF